MLIYSWTCFIQETSQFGSPHYLCIYVVNGNIEMQALTNHVILHAGVTCPSSFDQLRNASMQGGFGAVPRTSPPAASVYITSGTGPYVAFFYAIEVRLCCTLLAGGVCVGC